MRRMIIDLLKTRLIFVFSAAGGSQPGDFPSAPPEWQGRPAVADPAGGR